MVRKILSVKNPQLRQKSKTVPKIDKKTKGLIDDLKETLALQDDPEGVGLAAPQIGKNVRIFLIKYKKVNKVFINPEIVESRQTSDVGRQKTDDLPLEGCLSLPHYYSPIKRQNSAKLRYMDEEGKIHTEKFKGFYAQIVLHEMDHLNGVIFIDRALEQGKMLYKFEGEDWEGVEL